MTLLQRAVRNMSVSTFADRPGGGDAKSPFAQRRNAAGRLVDERRRYMRVAVAFEATLIMAENEVATPATVTEISRTGLRLRCAEQLTTRSLVEIRVDPAGRNRPVRVRGQVTRIVATSESETEYGIAVLSDLAVEAALQRAVLEVGLQSASSRTANVPPHVRIR